jgi:hypothetical protein
MTNQTPKAKPWPHRLKPPPANASNPNYCPPGQRLSPALAAEAAAARAAHAPRLKLQDWR